MCGIAGKVSLRGDVPAGLVESMCERQAHRGPDSRGIHRSGGVALGIQRLRIIDLETGDQPIFNEDRSVVVVQNGEIYNYRELRAQLRSRGHRFETETDTEVIAHLYEDHGEGFVDHLRGMFAIAIWDRRRERLVLARDRVGKKPLFYAAIGGTLWFGSEPRTIVEDPAVPRDVDFDAIDSFLHYQYVPHPKSAFKALRKLPPAHTLTWSNGRVETRRYWKLRYGEKLEGASEAEIQEMIRERLLEATRLRLRSDVPERLAGVAGCHVCEPDPDVLAAALDSALDHGRSEEARAAVESLSGVAVARRIVDVYRTAIGSSNGYVHAT